MPYDIRLPIWPVWGDLLGGMVVAHPVYLRIDVSMPTQSIGGLRELLVSDDRQPVQHALCWRPPPEASAVGQERHLSLGATGWHCRLFPPPPAAS